MEYINKFLSVKDIANILVVSNEVVNTWLRKGFIKYSLAGNLQKIRPEDFLEYLKKIGNSDYAMKEFERDIKMFLGEKAFNEAKTVAEMKSLWEKYPEIMKEVIFNKGILGHIVSSRSGKDNDSLKQHPFKDFGKAEKYINEAETIEEKVKRVAEVKNYIKGTGSKPWDEDK